MYDNHVIRDNIMIFSSKNVNHAIFIIMIIARNAFQQMIALSASQNFILIMVLAMIALEIAMNVQKKINVQNVQLVMNGTKLIYLA